MSIREGSFTAGELRDAFVKGAVLLEQILGVDDGIVPESPVELALRQVEAAYQLHLGLTKDPQVRALLYQHYRIVSRLSTETHLARIEGKIRRHEEDAGSEGDSPI
jgi:hypothetical protein